MDVSLSLELALLLAGGGAAAGFVDAIAGGGGLLTVPLLWAVGLSPAQVLATNKLQGSFGTLSAVWHFARRGLLDWRGLWVAVPLTLLGAAAGTATVQRIDPGFLAGVIPLLLLGNAAYFLFSPRIGDVERQQRIGPWGFSLSAGFGIGFYDGFFGPGTGSFFALAFVALLGFGLARATAHTKMLNFTSNITALAVFLWGGQVVWTVGLVMAAGQVVGAYAGSHLVIRRGSVVVKPLLVTVSLVLTAKLVFTHFLAGG